MKNKKEKLWMVLQKRKILWFELSSDKIPVTRKLSV